MPFELQPELRGELVEMRPLRSEDFDVLFGVASDALIWEQHPARDRYQESVFRAFFRDAMASGGALLCCEVQTGQVIGSSRFFGWDETLDEVEIGWSFLARSHWGGVYNGEMKRLMCRHAFRFVTNVVLFIDPNNLRSQRAAAKVGGVFAGSRPDEDGNDRYVYRITEATLVGG
jgi:RimJ/RimL family protein N-acetyltransferase